MNEKFEKPDYIFEVSWEVCNKVGGIYTVISTKAYTISKLLKDNYILLGPDVWKESSHNSEFIEDKFLFRSWREHAESEGLKFRIGRWNIAGNPIVILVDFTQYFSVKDTIFATFWENYSLDSLSGQWDYIEPTMFGYASGKIIESFYDFNLSSRDKIIAHFHEWMTGSGILHLRTNVPQIGTIFTTHATIAGRSIAGNGLPLYKDLKTFNADQISRNYGFAAKQSLEKIAAKTADCFTVVSDITAKECSQFLEKDVDIVTPNGFEDSFVPQENEFGTKREIARNKMFNVAEALLNQEISHESMLIATSGRYEFKNKGIDLFLDSLGKLNKDENLDRTIVAFLLIPANQAGLNTEVLERIHNCDFHDPKSSKYLTHWIHDPEYDPILKRICENGLRNSPEDKVKIIFVPSYLNGIDGIFNLSYYDVLIGLDITVFASYYEPWGYTPLESLAFHVPTITTTLAGFGLWVKSFFGDLKDGVHVITRNDSNDSEVVSEIKECLLSYSHKKENEVLKSKEKSFYISRTALWENLIVNYNKAFSIALEKSKGRFELFKNKQVHENITNQRIVKTNKPSWKKVLIQTSLPESLEGLQHLSRNLWWSWDFDAQKLFELIDPELWESMNHNPIALLESISIDKFRELEKNKKFTKKLTEVFGRFVEYMDQVKSKPKDLIAYFSMEFGLHDSIKIFSGGLGILAGDYLKQASDSNVNIMGIGLLYRYGYFVQTLSVSGEQIARYIPQKFSLMPLIPVRNEKDEWIIISITLPSRTLYAKAWKMDVGRTPLYLLDTDIEENSEIDRSITHQLYGGDWENRLKQEILLGIGGIKLIEALGLRPEIYHCNEGHAAFLCLERLRRLIENHKFSYYESLEIVRSSTLFTTHTPVPAGHDSFSEDLLRTYIPHFADKLNLSWETFMNLGRMSENDPAEKFSMSVLASKLSQEINAVSRIHCNVTRKMFNNIWEGYFPEELHINYVTNGVHFPTWVAEPWFDLYRKEFGEEFLYDQSNPEHWKKIFNVHDKDIWTIRQGQRKTLVDSLKKHMLDNIQERQDNPSMVLETIDAIDENALTIGFARRFATYKRAHLLFMNLKKLSEIVNDKNRPVQFLFAGKAHPNDLAGQNLIKNIIEISRKPEFLGKIIFIENYDIGIAKKLVQGVDIWLNTPTRPLEASGTSGEKAIMNGVVNFSVLDGWWAEGYFPGAGWALKEERTFVDQTLQDELDSETIYFLLEHEIIPAFYDRNEDNYSPLWISHIKNTIAGIAPKFTMKRMLDDYSSKFYNKMFEIRKNTRANNFENARVIAQWKKNIQRSWNSIEVVSVTSLEPSAKPLLQGETFKTELVLNLHELSHDDIGVEIVFGQKVLDEVKTPLFIEPMIFAGMDKNNAVFSSVIPMNKSGVYDYSFRIYPKHKLLPHRQDFPLVKWV